jgi:phage gp36-like protein
MTAYCTPGDVRQVLTPGGDGDDDETAASLTDDALMDAIGRATGIVNTYLSSRFKVPVPTELDPDGMLKTWSSVLAAYDATLVYSKGMDIGADDPIRLRFNQTMDMLKDIRDGKITPPWPGPDPVDNAGSVVVVNPYEGTMFGLRDFDIGDSRRPAGWGAIPGWGGDW